MEHPTAKQLLACLREGDESVEVEAKLGQKVGTSVMKTVCAFANEPGRGGGYLMLGVQRDEKMLFPDYVVVGVENSDQVQADLATQCREVFNVPVRPQTFVDQIDGKTVVWAYIQEADPQNKPVYFTRLGLPGGAFRRIGSTDQHGTDEDIALYYQLRGNKTYDETVVDGFDPDADIDGDAVEEYRKRRAEVSPTATELQWETPELLHALSATTPHGSHVAGTVCGLISFGKQSTLRRHCPLARVDYIRVEGREWVKDPDERYQTVEMRGPLLTLIPRVVAQVLDDIPTAFALDKDQLHRRDVPLIPQKVIREAVVNALMHRSYRMRQPVQIIRYSNRLEIRNPGHSLKPDDRLGEPGSLTRNEKIAAILHETGLAETKGSGVRVMRELMRQANLTLPLFESNREADTFTVTLLVHHLLDKADVAWLAQFKDCNLSEDEAKALVFVREVGAVNNAAYRDINSMDTLEASGHLRRLRDYGLLRQKGKAAQTYYVPGHRLLKSLEGTDGTEAPVGAPQTTADEEKASLSAEPAPLSTELESLSAKLPPGLTEEIQDLGQRTSPDRLDAVITELCLWKPLGIHELEYLTGRKAGHLRRSLRRLMGAGKLRYLYPDKPRHPDQKYVAESPNDSCGP